MLNFASRAAFGPAPLPRLKDFEVIDFDVNVRQIGFIEGDFDDGFLPAEDESLGGIPFDPSLAPQLRFMAPCRVAQHFLYKGKGQCHSGSLHAVVTSSRKPSLEISTDQTAMLGATVQ